MVIIFFVNDKIVVELKTLVKGEELIIDVSPLDKVKIEGSYEPFIRKKKELIDLWYRNQIISNSNKSHNGLI